jgi:NADH-quinone oxidoreductase subunit M
MNLPILSLLLIIPLVGVIFTAIIPHDKIQNIKSVALWIAAVNFVLSLTLWYQFDPYNIEFQMVERYEWIKSASINFELGVDGISLFFVILTCFFTPVVMISSWHTIHKRVREYLVCLLLLECFLVGTFLALDLILFYLFFEAVLIPMFFIIGIWGGENRLYACFKFFLYTLLGSVLMILAILKIYSELGSASMLVLENAVIRNNLQIYLWLAFFAAFAVKIPMWPFHTWLPHAHVEAPTGGSVMLAAVLLKMGGYGMARIMIPYLPYGSSFCAPYVQILSVVAIIYGSLVAFAQTDIKKLVAYSSVAHMGYVTLGLFSFNSQGLTGGVVQMISHGLISGALFLCVGFLYERFHTREIDKFGGLATIMPHFSTFFMVFTFASIGLPGTSGFIGEFLPLVGIYSVSSLYATLGALGMILGAVYMLWVYKKMCFGKVSLTLGERDQPLDLLPLEKGILGIITVGIIILGIYPKPITDLITRSGRHMIEYHYERAVKKFVTHSLETVPH